MLLNHRGSAKGQFRFCLNRGGVEHPFFTQPSKNMILDAFLNLVNSNSAYSFINYISSPLVRSFRLGVGATPVSPSDTGLVTPVILIPNTSTSLTASAGFLDTETDEIVCQQTVRGEIEITVARNLTEISAYTNTDGSVTATLPILSRALITDAEGEPAALNVQPGDILVVYYDFETRMPHKVTAVKTVNAVETTIEAVLHTNSTVHFPWADACIGSFNNSSGFNTNRTNHTASDFTFPNFLTAFNPGWTQTTDSITDRALQMPVAGTRGKRRRIGLQQANGTIRGLFVGESGAMRWIYKFTPAITKDNQKVIELESYMQLARA